MSNLLRTLPKLRILTGPGGVPRRGCVAHCRHFGAFSRAHTIDIPVLAWPNPNHPCRRRYKLRKHLDKTLHHIFRRASLDRLRVEDYSSNYCHTQVDLREVAW
jgi:hypothetical protein